MIYILGNHVSGTSKWNSISADDIPETMRERYPEDYEQLSKEPGFLILRLLKAARPDPSPPA